MKKFERFLVILLCYLLLPWLFIKDTGSGIFILIFFLPLITLAVGIWQGLSDYFVWYFAIVVGLLWVPNIFILNNSALFYSLLYAAIALTGQVLGLLLKKAR